MKGRASLVSGLARFRGERCDVMAIQLYKHTDSDRYYWRAGNNGNTVFICWGRVGSVGEVREITLFPRESPDAVIRRESAQARGQGYTEIDEDDLVQLVVQYQTEGWGSEDDLDKRHRVEEILGECLDSTGNGCCDGGDIGSGTINVFCYMVVPSLAVEAVCRALQSHELLDGATIAVRDDGEESYDVVWPMDFEGLFTLI